MCSERERERERERYSLNELIMVDMYDDSNLVLNWKR